MDTNFLQGKGRLENTVESVKPSWSSLRSSLGTSAQMEKNGKRNTVGRRPKTEQKRKKKS